MSTRVRGAVPEPSREDRLLAELCCSRLGLGPPADIVRLARGASGAPVLAAEVDGGRVVLKMTQQPERLLRAALEVRLLHSRSGLDRLAPELVASATGPGWVGIATRECSPLGSAPEIDVSTWLAASTRLAALHDGVTPVEGLARRPVDGPIRRDAAVLVPWVELGAGAAALRGAERLADPRTGQLPQVVAHGDSHLDNILRDPRGDLVWIDWQEAHLGDGLADLVFLWQRAEFDGGRPPRAEMTARYARARRLDPARLQPLLDQEELRLLLHSWPPFLSHGTPAGQATMRARLTVLAGG